MPSMTLSEGRELLRTYKARFSNWDPMALKHACNLGASDQLLDLLQEALKKGKPADLEGFARELNEVAFTG